MSLLRSLVPSNPDIHIQHSYTLVPPLQPPQPPHGTTECLVSTFTTGLKGPEAAVRLAG